jgi:hypothetical protein
MNETYNAIEKSMAGNWRASAGRSWEIYGDPPNSRGSGKAHVSPGFPGIEECKSPLISSRITEPPFSVSTPDTVPGPLTEVEFIEKAAKRFADTNGWGYAAFKYDPASDAFTPVTPATPSAAPHVIRLRRQKITSSRRTRRAERRKLEGGFLDGEEETSGQDLILEE